MALGRRGPVQADLLIRRQDIPKSPGHTFYDRLNELLGAASYPLEEA
ncbi:MAG: hypothetical protein ACE5LL_09390 [Alphaproteobacteria bacterium]